ncbi:hypothetical protein GX865_03635 [Candidatus Saccharibacteria bacterium]|jgi:hypothetical protein|nr:hypothetical protein [Candidatus Saccharibacteria bacterium]
MVKKKSNQKALVLVREMVNQGKVSPDELVAIAEASRAGVDRRSGVDADNSLPSTNRLSAIDFMYMAGGVILFSSIQALVWQLTGNDPGLVGAIVCLLAAVFIWILVLVQTKHSADNDVRRGMVLSLNFTGSMLLVFAAGYLTSHLVGSGKQTQVYLLVFSELMFIVALLHVLYAHVLRRRVALVSGFGILIASVSVLSFMLGLLVALRTVSADAHALVFIGFGLLIATLTRAAVRLSPKSISYNIFDGLAQFIVFLAMLTAAYGKLELLWNLILITSVLGLFYRSITKRNTSSFIIAAIFLTITLVSMSFRYFSDMGVAVSLFLSAMAVLAVATVSVSLRKKYLS